MVVNAPSTFRPRPAKQRLHKIPDEDMEDFQWLGYSPPFTEGWDTAKNPLHKVMREAGFVYIWQASPLFSDIFWDGLRGRVHTLWEAFEVFGLFLVVPEPLLQLRNFGLNQVRDELRVEQWKRAARVYAVLLTHCLEMNLPWTYDAIGIPDCAPLKVEWFLDGLKVLEKEGLVHYDGEQTVSMATITPRRFLDGIAGFHDKRGSLHRDSEELDHPNADGVSTDCEYTEDIRLRRKLR
jgi:hypothetical protein